MSWFYYRMQLLFVHIKRIWRHKGCKILQRLVKLHNFDSFSFFSLVIFLLITFKTSQMWLFVFFIDYVMRRTLSIFCSKHLSWEKDHINLLSLLDWTVFSGHFGCSQLMSCFQNYKHCLILCIFWHCYVFKIRNYFHKWTHILYFGFCPTDDSFHSSHIALLMSNVGGFHFTSSRIV